MGRIVIDSVEKQMTPQKPNGLYYSVALINRMMFEEDDMDRITHILRLYFTTFNTIMRDEKSNRTISLILKGITQIVDTLDTGSLTEIMTDLDTEVNSLFALSHKALFKIRVQVLTLLFGFIKAQEQFRDRFYRTLYELL